MENDLKRLSRMELLQLLLQVTESNEALVAENEELRNAPSMQISQSTKVGSIAEAALKANGFFEAAQRSADDYLREIKKLRDEMVERNKARAPVQPVATVSAADEFEQSQIFERIQDQAKAYIQDVQTYANNVMARANSQAQAIVSDAQQRSDEIIAEASERARAIVEEAESQAAAIMAVPEELLSQPELFEAESLEDELSDEVFQEDELLDGAFQEDEPLDDEVQEAVFQDDASSEEAVSDVESQDDDFQATAPIDAVPSASDSGRGTYMQDELDPGSTGALVRRGRHVKIPEGMTM